MASRFFALLVWAAVAASVAYWGLRWLSRPAAVPAHATPVTLDAAVRGDIHRLLNPPAQAASGPVQALGEAQALIGRLKLLGVVAPRAEAGDSGIALLSLDGKPARAVRVGMVIDGSYVLRSLSQRSAGIGMADGPVVANLDLPLMPPPSSGMLPPPTGVIQSPTMPSVATMQGSAPVQAPVNPSVATPPSVGNGGAVAPPAGGLGRHRMVPPNAAGSAPEGAPPPLPVAPGQAGT